MRLGALAALVVPAVSFVGQPWRGARALRSAIAAPRTQLSMEMGAFEMLAPAIGTALLGVGVKLTSDDPTEAIDDKKEVEGYFNDASDGGGFDRWNRIYSEEGDVNNVQLDIRDGHQITIDKVLEWVDADSDSLSSVADVGCGVGSLAIPLAKRGATVSASDISAAMAKEAGERCAAAGVPAEAASFSTADLESLDGKYDTVTCIDVMIHYPSDKMAEMVSHLASCSDRRLLISFAPKTPALALLKKIGGLFPGPSKTTRAYLHPEDKVRDALKAAGFEVKREHLTSSKFYFSQLFEAVRV